MIKKLKRIVAGMLVAITLVTAMPITAVNAASDGDKQKATIESLGNLELLKLVRKVRVERGLKPKLTIVMFFAWI